MTPEQAIELIDKAIQQISANRVTHIQLAQAVETIKSALKPQALEVAK